MSRPAAFLPALLLVLLVLPGSAAHAASSNIRISQFFGGGSSLGVYNQDYVELFNASASPVNVGGWVLQYAPANGIGLCNLGTVPAGTVIPPCRYLLIGLYAVPGGRSLVPAADVTMNQPYTDIDPAGGQLAIKSLNAACGEPCTFYSWVDVVTWGPAACFQGSGPAAAPGALAAAFRRNGGLQDDDNAVADFVTGTPAPRGLAASGNPQCMATPVAPATWGSLKTLYH
jgi:hypothetical protein